MENIRNYWLLSFLFDYDHPSNTTDNHNDNDTSSNNYEKGCFFPRVESIGFRVEPIHQCTRPSIHPLIYPSTHSYIHPSIYPSWTICLELTRTENQLGYISTTTTNKNLGQGEALLPFVSATSKLSNGNDSITICENSDE